MSDVVAAIDIGTNSVLLLVAEATADGPRALVERATITRLGAGVDRTRSLAPDACKRTLACLSEYAETISEFAPQRVEVVGTSAMRDAAGGAAFADEAERILGARPRVIDGDEEAELSFVGAVSGLPVEGSVLVFDIGGGSTELIVGEVRGAYAAPSETRSLNIGSVRLFERHITTDPPTHAELERIGETVRGELRHGPLAPPGATLIGVAGTVTTLAAVSLGLEPYNAARVHGMKLEPRAVHELLESLASMPLETRRRVPGLEPMRADVIVVGALITSEILKWFAAAELTVSDRGVRWGLVQRMLRR